MTCDFISFSTVFQSYQVDGQVVMKGYVQWEPFVIQRFLLPSGLEPRTAFSVGQCLTQGVSMANSANLEMYGYTTVFTGQHFKETPFVTSVCFHGLENTSIMGFSLKEKNLLH